MTQLFRPNRKYPTIPTITGDLDSHTRALQALAECVSIHERRTKDIDNSFVRVHELVDMGLITLAGDDFNRVNIDLSDIANAADLSGAADNDFLRYDADTNEWVNATLETGDITAGMVTQHGDPRYARLAETNEFTEIQRISSGAGGEQLQIFDTSATDPNDYGVIEKSGDTLRLYGWDASAAAWRLFLSGNVTTRAVVIGDGGANSVDGTLSVSGAITQGGVPVSLDGHTHTAASITSPAALTKTDDTNVTLTLGGSPTTALLQATSLTLGWTGQLSVARGGTGVSSLSSLTANPTASVGLTAVNGSASTFMRSDAAPALSVSIVPTWTGLHTFTVSPLKLAPTTGAADLRLTSTNAGVNMIAEAASGSNAQMTFIVGATTYHIEGSAGTAGNIINGSAIGDYCSRVPSGSKFLFSTDGGTSIAVQISSGVATFNSVPVVPNDSFTYAKLQNVSATSRVLGRITSGAGDIEELTGANLATIIGTNLGANPSASVGLTAVNGSAGTYMRSDAAPALDVTITPTWSAQHTFSKVGGGPSSAILISSTTPGLSWNETGAAADNKNWDVYAGSSALHFRAVNDANSSAGEWMTVARSGVSISSITMGGVTRVPDGSVSAPGLAFSGDTDTGIYRSSSNRIRIGCGGVLALQIIGNEVGVITVGAYSDGVFGVPDGISTPVTVAGYAVIYVDSADGDLKVKFGDGTVRTIVAD